MKSRYDRNQELYEKVKNNDYEDYNNNIKDIPLEFERKESREELREKKRLSMYFKDIDSELETANSKLNDISEDSGMEIKKNVDLKSLIEQAKKNQREQGGSMFTNTQYEILSSLNVEEQNTGLDEEEKDLILEDIIGQTMEITSKVEAVDDEFDNTVVNLQSLDGFEEAFATKNMTEDYDDYDDTDMLEFSEMDIEDFENESDYEESFKDNVEEHIENFKDEVEEHLESFEDELEEIEDEFDEIEEELEEIADDLKKASKKKKRNKKEKNIEDNFDDEEEEENSMLLTIILVVLIIALIAVGSLIILQYV